MDHRQLLAEVTSIRKRTHADLNGESWRWLSVWSAASLGFVLTLVVPAWHGVTNWYWMAGVPVAMIATFLAEHADPTADRRVRRRGWPYWATGAAITSLITGAGMLVPGAWILVWIWIVFAGGFAVLLHLDGEPQFARGLVAMSATFALVGIVATDPVGASVVCGSVFVAGLSGMAWASRSKSAA